MKNVCIICKVECDLNSKETIPVRHLGSLCAVALLPDKHIHVFIMLISILVTLWPYPFGSFASDVCVISLLYVLSIRTLTSSKIKELWCDPMLKREKKKHIQKAHECRCTWKIALLEWYKKHRYILDIWIWSISKKEMY